MGKVAGPSAAPAKKPATHQPNIVLVVVDDQARNSFQRSYMPHAFADLVERGTRFVNGLAAPPDCCPDRAGILTGEYPHNHGVFSDRPGYLSLRDPGNTLPVWLHRAGYRTGLVGKFLNKYRETQGSVPAPGFDQWFMGAGNYYGYGVSDNGVPRHYGTRRQDYSTDVLTQQAMRFVRGRSPFFLWLGYNAPHVANRHFGHPYGNGPCRGPMPEPPSDAAFHRFRRVPLPRPPSFNERRVGDKPTRIRSLPTLSQNEVRVIRRRWRCTLATMSTVDADLHRLFTELHRRGELSKTIIVYVSDNGLFFGEHRIPAGKGFPYEEALRVPFVVRVPPSLGGGPPLVRKVVSNQDIAPTLLHYAHAKPCAAPNACRLIDGHSLVPLLGGPGTWPKDRGVLAELNTKTGPECACAYEAIRTQRYMYDEWSTGEKELYDLKVDPNELRNLAGSAPYGEIQRSLAERLARLRHCSGPSCQLLGAPATGRTGLSSAGLGP
jgi:arylsulfatase A-like enzyme